MKKTILSLAMFGAFTGAAMAQSNVQLYGIIDVGFEHLTYDNSSVNRIGSGIQSGSRIGLKGTEDLGGGLSAFFQAETGFCANGNGAGSDVYNTTYAPTQGAQAQAGGSYCTSGSTFMGRTSIVGLTGNFGTVQAGRMYSDYFNNMAAVDPFGAGMTGTLTNIDLGAVTYVRASQTVAYVSPNFSGIQGVAAYGFGAQSTGNSNGQAYNLSLKYNNGPIFAGIGYLHHNMTPPAALAPSIVDGYLTQKFLQAFGSYDFGVAKISALYANEKWADNQPVHLNMDVWMLGATVPVGPGSILASFSTTKDKDVGDTTSRQYAIGYTYALSKQTNLYTSYSRITNNANTDLLVGDATLAPGAGLGTGSVGGASSSGFALGIRHQF